MDFLGNALPFKRKIDYICSLNENKIMNQARIYNTSFKEYIDSPTITSGGAIIICPKGNARIQINFNH